MIMGKIIDGKAIANALQERLKEHVLARRLA